MGSVFLFFALLLSRSAIVQASTSNPSTPALSPSSGPSLISQIVGQAGESVASIRDVKINYFVEVLLFADGAKPKSPVLSLSDPGFEKEVTRVLMEIVVAKEAKNFNASPAPEDDVQKSIQLIRQSTAKEELAGEWNKLGVSNSELRDVIIQKLNSKKFIQFKTRASSVPVTDAEALQYYQRNRNRFGQAPFTQFRESIKAFLSQDQSNARLRDWIELLQRKYKVKRIGVQRTPTSKS